MTILLEQPRSDTKSHLSPVTHDKNFQGYSTTRTRLYCSSCRGGTELAGLWSQNGEDIWITTAKRYSDLWRWERRWWTNMKRSNISPGCLHMTIGEQVSGEPCAPHVRASSPHDPADHVSSGTKSTSVLWAP